MFTPRGVGRGPGHVNGNSNSTTYPRGPRSRTENIILSHQRNLWWVTTAIGKSQSKAPEAPYDPKHFPAEWGREVYVWLGRSSRRMRPGVEWLSKPLPGTRDPTTTPTGYPPGLSLPVGHGVSRGTGRGRDSGRSGRVDTRGWGGRSGGPTSPGVGPAGRDPDTVGRGGGGARPCRTTTP